MKMQIVPQSILDNSLLLAELNKRINMARFKSVCAVAFSSVAVKNVADIPAEYERLLTKRLQEIVATEPAREGEPL